MAKVCKQCGASEPAVEFPPNRLLCKPCFKAKRAQEQLDNKEARNAQARASYYKHKEAHSIAAAARYQKTKETVKARVNKYRLENLDIISQKNKEKYAADPEPAKVRAADRRTAKLPELMAYVECVKASPCSNCHHLYPSSAMDLHHVRGTKVAAIATMVSSLRPLDEIIEEVAKCELLCANCHRILHADQKLPDESSHPFHMFE